jgi:hypothetical protein
VDAAISASKRDTNQAYKKLQAVQGLIKSSVYVNNTDGVLINKKNGGRNVCYVDWLNQIATTEWQNQLSSYLTNVAPFDGLWTTDNEPFGEVTGEVNEGAKSNLREESTLLAADPDVNPNVDQSWFYSFWPLDNSSTYKLPFVPQFEVAGNYDAFTLSLNGSHNFSNV